MINGDNRSYRLGLHESIHMIHREDWMQVASMASPYLNYDHLQALEDVMTGRMEFRYAIFYCEQNQPMGVACFQVVDLVDQGSSYRQGVQRLGKGVGSRILSEMKVRCLVSGNVFHCGDHGSFFLPGIPAETRLLAIEDTLRRLDKGCHLSPLASVSIVKELWPDQYAAAVPLETKGFAPLNMEPNMLLDMDPSWVDLSAYSEALTAKARTRLRAILSRSSGLEIRPMEAGAIENGSARLQQLLDAVLDRAPFNFGRLRTEVYAAWKMVWGNKLVFRGFYAGDELVGFSASFIIGDALDVQYVGFDPELNMQHGVYQRMLVDQLEVAMDLGLKRILFGRTAEQAKSNLGAEPEGMRFYVRHRSRLANKLIGPFLRRVEPETFEKRSPFKKALV